MRSSQTGCRSSNSYDLIIWCLGFNMRNIFYTCQVNIKKKKVKKKTLFRRIIMHLQLTVFVNIKNYSAWLHCSYWHFIYKLVMNFFSFSFQDFTLLLTLTSDFSICTVVQVCRQLNWILAFSRLAFQLSFCFKDII